MSGIVGILNRDGAPVDRDLLGKMTGFLAFRGPDARDIWINGPAGFGHTLLRTTWESAKEKQPSTLDGQVWITADVRIDAREDLIRELQAAGRDPSPDVTDPELILHAYHAWDEQCLEHLLGDFSFGIWDQRTRRLFCARDHFGVKLFYYSQAGGNFIFSNTLKCIRLSPAVSSKLNDAAIADFLLFDSNQNPVTTTFSDIQRLPAAHFLVWSEQQFRTGRYWTLPVDGPTFYKRADDYVEHFKEVLRSAVRDRLRTDRVGVFMSGGLDSSGLAATAREILSARPAPYDLRAYTMVYDHLIPYDERPYAGMVADALHIPIHFLVADGYRLYERWEQPELRTPEPVHSPITLSLNFDQSTQISTHCRVSLYGQGPDNILYYEWQPYVSHLSRTFRWGRLLGDLCRHIRFHRGIPAVWGLRNRIRRRRVRQITEPSYPRWIRPEILKLVTNEEPGRAHPFHPAAYKCMTGLLWEPMFESCDPGSSSFPLEVRHPYLDVRIVRYLLAIPPIPWCRDKYLLRRSFQGVLPDAVLRRRKTPLQGNPTLAHAKCMGLPQWTPEASLFQYVDPEAVRAVLKLNEAPLWESLRPISLNFFLAFNGANVREYQEGASTDDTAGTMQGTL